MKSFKKIALLFVLLLGICILLPACSQQDTQQATATVYAKDFAIGQLEPHFMKHKDDFDYATAKEYLEGARQILDNPKNSDILEKIRPNGDILHYKVSTGEFAVMTKEGRIRTYFKADSRYWMRQ